MNTKRFRFIVFVVETLLATSKRQSTRAINKPIAIELTLNMAFYVQTLQATSLQPGLRNFAVSTIKILVSTLFPPHLARGASYDKA